MSTHWNTALPSASNFDDEVRFFAFLLLRQRKTGGASELYPVGHA
jgi:hypothetical protein